ncbi:MAG: helix-turn-helix transcriptional regulator [Actinomycetota bacterium]|nr:helix-turn-helix transcriptional regulator [Actinomycetota bacterium]
MKTDKKVRTTRDIAAAARGRRLGLGLSQTAVARKARVSRQWLSKFESGKPTAEFSLILQLLDALDLEMSLSTRKPPAEGSHSGGLDELLDRHRK